MDKYSSSPGISEEALMASAARYEKFKQEKVEMGFDRPVGVGVLMWDEVKVSKTILSCAAAVNFRKFY